MNTKKKWNVEGTCKLIELYRESPILWDATNLNYKNNFKKADALIDSGMQLGTDANEIDRKLKNFGYESMSFLQDKNKPRKCREAGLTEGSQISDISSDEAYDDNIELCTPNTQLMAVDENIFERNEGNSTSNLQITDESNILAPVEFSRMATPKNLKYRKKFGSPDHLISMKMKIELKRFLK
ncbi:hypothetical protein QTP88_012177 [Uroleucon formosanum]